MYWFKDCDQPHLYYYLMDTVDTEVVTTRDKVSVITMLHGEVEFIPMILENMRRFKDTQELELIVVDDGSTSLAHEFTDIESCLYLHLNSQECEGFFAQILEGFKGPNKSPLYYQRVIRTLPLGFKRDYGCGLSSHPYLFHMNADCVYDPKAIDRKLRFMKRVGAECVYNDAMLCYDIYNQKLYKTESVHKIYEATLCHTRDFWSRRGFQWSDVEYEGKYFHYNNGTDRKQDNYYDTIQLLSIHNMNKYRPVEVSLEGKDIAIPSMVADIKCETHPFVRTLHDIYGQRTISLLGINSEFLDNVQESTWNTYNLTDKWKQTKLAKHVRTLSGTDGSSATNFHVLVYGSKHPAWDLFEHEPFDLVMLETQKNYEQMNSILTSCKNHPYICVGGVYVRQAFLEPSEPSEPSEPTTPIEWDDLSNES